MQCCKGICINYLAEHPDLNTSGRYELGQKRCSSCEIFLKWDKQRCPCCSTILRVKPRGRKSKVKLLNRVR